MYLAAAREINFEAWLKRYFSSHPAMRKYSGVPIRKVDFTSRTNEASFTSKGVELYPKFWTLDAMGRDFALTHEIGHSVESAAGLSGLIKAAEALGIDPWDTANLPFGQFKMTEAFADSFASYHLDGDVQRRYPLWATLVEVLSR
jgi:hypothetical protein